MVYSIIQKSQLEGAQRIDAEYYQLEYFIDFSKGRWTPIGDLLDLCQYGISQAMNDKRIGYPIFRMDDLKQAFVVDDELKYVDVSEKDVELYKLSKKDILFNRVNSEEFVGRTGIFNLEGFFVFASYLIRLRVRESCDILPEYLDVFLNSSYGIKQIRKYRRRAVNQANVNAEELKQIKIAILPTSDQEEIARLLNISWDSYLQSKYNYQQAENLLLEELGLSSFAKATEDEKDLSWIVNLSDVQSANRIDAEYFQPKYEKLISKIKNPRSRTSSLRGKQNAKLLKDFIEDYSTGYPFKSENYQEEGIPLIRINNIRKGYIDLSDTAYLLEKDYLLSPKDTAKSGDIVLSMSGTIGMSAIIPDGITKCSINQRILRITSKNIDRDYLVLVLNSIVGSFQLERIGTGGVQTNISYKDIKNILIPELPKLTQQKIADLVQKSHKARKKSKELLEEAKRKVETSIETQSKEDDRFSKLTTS